MYAQVQKRITTCSINNPLWMENSLIHGLTSQNNSFAHCNFQHQCPKTDQFVIYESKPVCDILSNPQQELQQVNIFTMKKNLS